MPRKFLGGKPTVGDTPVVIETRTITATAPVTIAGTTSADLSADRTIAVSAASTSAAGVVQLSDSTSTTGSTKAATETAVKSAYDLADAAIPKSLVDAKGDLLVGTAADTVGRLAVGATNGHVLTVDSTAGSGIAWAAVSGGDYTWVIKSSDESVTSSTVFQDDDALTFSLATNSVYWVEFAIYYTAGATSGIKWQWTFPANAGVAEPNISTTASISATDFDTSSPTAALNRTAAETRMWFGKKFIYTGGTSGSFTLQFAQQASGATAATMKAGSFLAYKKLV